MTTIPNFMLPGETIQNLYNEGGVYASLASSLFNPTGSPTYRVFATGTNAAGRLRSRRGGTRPPS